MTSTPALGSLNGFGFRVRVVLGYSSKVYIGDSSETITAHVHRALYPNNTGSLAGRKHSVRTEIAKQAISICTG